MKPRAALPLRASPPGCRPPCRPPCWAKLLLIQLNPCFAEPLAQYASQMTSDVDVDEATCLGQDLQAAALIIAELFSAALAPEESDDSPPSSTTGALQRLLFEVFPGDLEGFKNYCLSDDRYGEFVDFMNMQNGAGWQLLSQLLSGQGSCRLVLETNSMFMGML